MDTTLKLTEVVPLFDMEYHSQYGLPLLLMGIVALIGFFAYELYTDKSNRNLAIELIWAVAAAGTMSTATFVIFSSCGVYL